MQWFRHKRTVFFQLLRIFQIIGAIACIVYYAHDVTAARKRDKYMDSKWLYATVVGAMSLVTSLVYLVTGFWFEMRAFSLICAWDIVLTILWTVVAGIFGMMYLNEKAEMDEGIEAMKVAAGFDLANLVLWAITGSYGAWIYWMEKGALMHTGRSKMAEPTKEQTNDTAQAT